MKKIAFLTAITPFLTATSALASHVQGHINIDTPQQGFSNLGKFITNTLTVAFVVAILVVLVMLIWGAFEWITSGGDKEAVGKARGRIINALIGLAVLAVAFALAAVAAQFVGINIQDLTVPGP